MRFQGKMADDLSWYIDVLWVLMPICLPCCWHLPYLHDSWIPRSPLDSCYCHHIGSTHFNTLRPGQNGRHFADDIFKCIFFNENVWIPIEISLQFVPKGPIDNSPALVQIVAWRRPGDKPLSELMMVRLSTHICVPRPQWLNTGREDLAIIASQSPNQ